MVIRSSSNAIVVLLLTGMFAGHREAGAQSPGKLPAWTSQLQEPTGQAWRPKPAPNASTERVSVPLVNYGGEWTRHGFGGHGGGPCTFRSPKSNLLGLTKDPTVIFQDIDLDGDGETKDDFVAAMPFSMTEPFSIPDWPLGAVHPHRLSSRFYGGVSWMVANSDPKKHKWVIEHGINPDHQGPFYDDRSEDHPLNAQPDNKNPDSFVKNYWLFVWKKQDFWNGGDANPVTFDDNSCMAWLIARYWFAVNDVRAVVQDGKQLYVSERDFWKLDKEHFERWGELDKPKIKMGWTTGRLFRAWPTKHRWAAYNPEGYKLEVPGNDADYKPHQFKDVQAVGWYIAKNDTSPSFFHVKWYGFEASGVVERQKRPSEHLAMANIAGDVDVPAFTMSACEVPFLLWREIYRYAESPFYTLSQRFNFLKHGDVGSAQYGNESHAPDEPVTNLTIYDMAAWCNGLSEKEGRQPCYYTDAACTKLFRFDEIATRATHEDSMRDRNKRNPTYEPIVLPKLYVKWSADGYRLPTLAEWLAALKAGGQPTASAAAKKTAAVGSAGFDKAGLADMNGNVREFCWTFADCFDPSKNPILVAAGSDFLASNDPLRSAASPYGDRPFDGYFNIGFRPVRRQPGAAKPAIGPVPTASGISAVAGVPLWAFGQADRTKVDQRAKPPVGVVEMVAIPGGTYKRPCDEATVKINAFDMGKFEVTYDQWRTVLLWAKANSYEFTHDADMGSSDMFAFAHEPSEPVTALTWHDALVWCNALSELEGRKPAYFEDPACTRVYKKAFRLKPIRLAGPELANDPYSKHGDGDKEYLRGPGREPFIFAAWDGDGYRLPTASEWEYAAFGGMPTPFWGGEREKVMDYAWLCANAGGRTHPVGQKKPNPYGLYDIIGNVYEVTWSTEAAESNTLRPFEDDTNNPKHSRYWNYGLDGKVYFPKKGPVAGGSSWLWQKDSDLRQCIKTDVPVRSEERWADEGFRIVRCTAGTHPKSGDEPIQTPVLVKVDPAKFDPLLPTADKAAHRGSLYRNGLFETTGPEQQPKARWTFATGGAVQSSPVVAGDRLYVGSLGGAFYCLDVAKGVQLWKVPVEGGVESSACVADGVVYFGGNDGFVYAVNATTGKTLWRTKVGKSVNSSPAVAYGTVFALAKNRPVGLKAESGEPFWSGRTGSCVDNAAMTVTPTDLIMAQNNANSVYWVDIATQLTKKMAMTGQYSRSTVAVLDDVAYVTNAGNVGGAPGYPGLNAYDLKTRQHKFPGRYIEEHLEPKDRKPMFSSPAAWNGMVYCAMDSGFVYACAAKDGKQAWQFQAGAAVRSSPAIAAKSGLLYFGCNDQKLYCVDAKTGKLRWTFATKGEISSSPWLRDGVVYVGSDDGFVYAIER